MRAGKPRESGLTHVIDKGMTLSEIDGMFEIAGDYVDIVKMGWGTSYVTRNLKAKVRLYQSYDTPVMCGGTLLEAAVARGRMDDFRRWVDRATASPTSRCSDGTLRMERESKQELIRSLAEDFVVLSEVGSEDQDSSSRPTSGSAGSGGARGRRLEGDHRGSRDRHGGIFRGTARCGRA